MPHYSYRPPNIEDFRYKEIRQAKGAQTFRWLAHVQRHAANRSETSRSVS